MITPFRIAAVALPLFVAVAASAQAPTGLTLEKFQDIARSRLMERDADGDGRISAAEFAVGGGKGKSGKLETGARHTDPTKAFARLDSNGDGYLDKAEIDAMTTKRFERMDANHDGVLTADERSAMRGHPAPAQ